MKIESKAVIYEDLISKLEIELHNTLFAYKSLIDQSVKLAELMGYSDFDVLRKIMPKNSTERTEHQLLIAEWFEDVKYQALENMMAREVGAITKKAERRQLLSSLNLTSEQIALLGISS